MKTSPVYETPADEYNKKLAEALKQIPEFKEPEWAVFVKTGTAKKRPPQEQDFWHKRAASILRQIYIHKTVGVNRLKTRYGSRKNRGMKPERFRKGSGKIIRVILQQAGAAKLLEKYNESGKRAGRILTAKGKKLLENIKEDAKESVITKESSEKLVISQESSEKSVTSQESREKKPISSSEKPIKDTKKEKKAEKPIKDTEKVQKDIKEAEKEIAEDVAEGASEKQIKEDIGEAKEEIKEDVK